MTRTSGKFKGSGRAFCNPSHSGVYVTAFTSSCYCFSFVARCNSNYESDDVVLGVWVEKRLGASPYSAESLGSVPAFSFHSCRRDGRLSPPVCCSPSRHGWLMSLLVVVQSSVLSVSPLSSAGCFATSPRLIPGQVVVTLAQSPPPPLYVLTPPL